MGGGCLSRKTEKGGGGGGKALLRPQMQLLNPSPPSCLCALGWCLPVGYSELCRRDGRAVTPMTPAVDAWTTACSATPTSEKRSSGGDLDHGHCG